MGYLQTNLAQNAANAKFKTFGKSGDASVPAMPPPAPSQASSVAKVPGYTPSDLNARLNGQFNQNQSGISLGGIQGTDQSQNQDQQAYNPMGINVSKLNPQIMADQQKKKQEEIDNDPLNIVKKQQADFAAEYTKNLPNLQQKYNEMLSRNQNDKMTADLSNIREKNQSRGLLYGGINKGQEFQERGKSQQDLNQSISEMNTNLSNAANMINAQAVETGVGIQHIAQMNSNQMFQQEMATQQANNSMMGSLASTGFLAYLAFA